MPLQSTPILVHRELPPIFIECGDDDYLPETKGQSLEEIEESLISK